ncbi:Flp pilus assembly protein CpaB [bacterium]|nr:MAG: Flp pilus assembly protein CpaB [bacterium]
MSKQKMLIIGSVVFGILAVFFLNNYLQQQRQIAEEDARREMRGNQSAVLVAKQDLPKGTVIEGNLLASIIISNQDLQAEAVTSLDRVDGMITTAQITKGEQLTMRKLANIRQESNLAGAIPIGKRAITINADNISSLVGLIKPGDYVDVISLVPIPVQTPDGKQATQVGVMPLFQNVLILAVGQDTGAAGKSESRYKKDEKRESAPLITLALTPQEANIIAFVQEQGKIRLSLRSPGDSQVQQVQPASWDTVIQYAMPNMVRKEAPQEVKKAEPQAEGYVEVYRGLNKEKVPIYK